MSISARQSGRIGYLAPPPQSAPDAPVAQRIQALRREADWDGEGAGAITAEMCTSAITFLEHLPRQVAIPRISPSALGAVSFYWEKDGVRLLVEVSDTDTVYFQQAGPGTFRDRGTLPQEEMAGRLRDLFRSGS